VVAPEDDVELAMRGRPGFLLLAAALILAGRAAQAAPSDRFHVTRPRRLADGISVGVAFARGGDLEATVRLYLNRLDRNQSSVLVGSYPGRGGEVVRVKLPYQKLGIRPKARGFLIGLWGGNGFHGWGGPDGSSKPSGTIYFPSLKRPPKRGLAKRHHVSRRSR
jgi:hypothetical protein